MLCMFLRLASFYGKCHEDILQVVQNRMADLYPEIHVETKPWGAEIGDDAIYRAHRLVFMMNLRFSGSCYLCDDPYSTGNRLIRVHSKATTDTEKT